jgi:hypothetical protein
MGSLAAHRFITAAIVLLGVSSITFILNRDGKVMLAVYSSGAIGRLTAKDCLGLIKHLQKQEDQN